VQPLSAAPVAAIRHVTSADVAGLQEDLDAFTDGWLANRRLSGHTREAYRRDVRSFLDWCAQRELEEETSLVGTEFTHLFQFGGLSKRHLVFFVDLPQDASPEPRNENSRCRWFSPTKISTLVTSIPTREIVDLFLRHENRGETPSAVIDKPDGRANGTGQPYVDVADTAPQRV